MKCVCSEYRCNWHGMESEVLTAPDPFNQGETLYACPECRTVGSVVEACDEPECWAESSCGTPTESGYRRTCGKHRPNCEVSGVAKRSPP